MGKKRLSATVVVLGVVALLGLPTTPAQAEDASCSIEIPDLLVDPGLSTEPNSGVFHTHTENGRIDCGQGRTGTIGVDGRYGTAGPASCQQGGEGWGVFSVTLGDRRFKDAFTFRFGQTSKGVLAGEVSGERIAGQYTFTGTEGNCATSPITKGAVKFISATVRL